MLEIKNNILSALPEGLEECPLTRLEASDNHMLDIPDNLHKLTTITVRYLYLLQ